MTHVAIDKNGAFRSDVARRMQVFFKKEHDLKRQLARDDMALPEYERPLKSMPRVKIPFTVASAYAFSKQVIKSNLP